MSSINGKKLIKTILFFSAFAVVVLLSYHQSKNLLEGPKILINKPLNGYLLSVPTTTISGKIENIAHLTLNGRQIFTDENGNFSMNILLLKGYNVVTISAKDKFGREVNKSIQLVYKNNENQKN